MTDPDIRPARLFASPQQEVVLSILRTNDLFQHRFGRLFSEHALTQAQFNLLRILRGADGPLPTLEIGRRMLTVVPGITRLVDALAKRDLVERQRCTEDRRVCRVAITPKGLAVLKELDTPNLALHDALVGHLTAAECERLVSLLDKARAAVEAHPS